MNAEQHRTSKLAAQWLRHTDAGENKLATALTAIAQRTQDHPVSHITGMVSAVNTQVQIRARLGAGYSAAELSVTSAIQGPVDTQVTYDVAQATGVPQPRPLDRFSDIGVIAEHTGLDPNAVEHVLTHLGQASRWVAYTAYQHAAEAGVTQIQTELAPYLGAAHQPSASQIDLLSMLAEQHARAQAALDLNAAYVELTQTAQHDHPDRLSSAGLANQIGSDVQVEIDYELAELITEHWRHTYTSALNDALGVVPAIDTPTEKAMFAKLAEQEWEAAQSSFPQSAQDQLKTSPPSADRDDPPPPPNPFNDRDPDSGRDDSKGR